MPYYKDSAGKPRIIDSYAHYSHLPPGCVEITKTEFDLLSMPTATQLHAEFRVSAQAALNKSDITMMRCVEAGIVAPAAWNTYRKALRAIASGVDTTSTTLPIQPEYPVGT